MKSFGCILMTFLVVIAELGLIEAGNNVGAALATLIPLGFALVIGLSIRRI